MDKLTNCQLWAKIDVTPNCTVPAQKENIRADRPSSESLQLTEEENLQIFSVHWPVAITIALIIY